MGRHFYSIIARAVPVGFRIFWGLSRIALKESDLKTGHAVPLSPLTLKQPAVLLAEMSLFWNGRRIAVWDMKTMTNHRHIQRTRRGTLQGKGEVGRGCFQCKSIEGKRESRVVADSCGWPCVSPPPQGLLTSVLSEVSFIHVHAF